MHVKDILDDLDIRIKLPQHWYSTDVIVIDVNDGMSVVTVFPDKKVIGVKYLDNKDDFEYIGHPSDLYF